MLQIIDTDGAEMLTVKRQRGRAEYSVIRCDPDHLWYVWGPHDVAGKGPFDSREHAFAYIDKGRKQS